MSAADSEVSTIPAHLRFSTDLSEEEELHLPV
jgi:hypothetical protein